MRHLILIRHALTTWNSTGRFQGQTDVPLSSEGRAQALALRGRLAGFDIDAVYSSPLQRALQTAHLALPEFEPIVDARLKEIHFGAFEGSTLSENRAKEAWDVWYEDPFGRRTPGGESYRDLRLRAVAWLEGLPQGCVVAFTHSGTIGMLLSHIMGVEHPRWRKRVMLRHTSLTCVVFRDDEVFIERVNDAGHLATPLLQRNGRSVPAEGVV